MGILSTCFAGIHENFEFLEKVYPFMPYLFKSGIPLFTLIIA